MHGTPYFMRLDAGLRRPKVTRIGVDFAGTVEAVGKNVKEFKPGDEVFGPQVGAFGEYLVARETGLVKKAENMTFEQAAAVPVAGLTALQAIRDRGKVKPGQTVLINGASGGVGTFAVQIAKSLGGNVTGVCSTRNVEMVRALGADQVIDYTKQNYAQGGQKYDLIVDMVGNHSLLDNKRVLNPDGQYVMIGAPKGKWIKPMDRVAYMAMLRPFVKPHFGFMMARLKKDDMEYLRDLIQSGKVTPVIDRRYTLDQTPEAMAYLETGRARGKVVITIP
jgi:NADPH:quinone reductase-like Zn-dependent oxidoreductase